MNEKTKKILNITKKVLVGLLIAFTVFMMIFTLFSVFALDKNERSLFGTRFYIVQSDSMSKSDKNEDMDVHFNAGDIILSKKLKDKDAINDLEPGDIISFVSSNSDSWGETITHMIHEVKRDSKGNIVEVTTFGTNTGAIDEAPVEPEFILGKYKGKLPKIGNFFAFVKTVPGYICCILAPFLFIIVYNLSNVISLFKKYKGEQTATIKAEKAQLEKDREENQRMMQELMALKAQLEAKNADAAAAAPPAASAPAASTPTAPAAPVAETPVTAPAASEANTEASTTDESAEK